MPQPRQLMDARPADVTATTPKGPPTGTTFFPLAATADNKPGHFPYVFSWGVACEARGRASLKGGVM